MKSFLKNNLYKRVILLSVIPAAIISIGITIYFTSLRISDTQTVLEQRSQALANQIASENINQVFTDNINQIASNIKFYLKTNEDLVKVEIYSNTGLLHSDSKDNQYKNLNQYQADIKLIPISENLGDFEENQPAELLPVIIGKTVIQMNDKMAIKTQELVKVAVITILSIIFIATILSLYLTYRIFKPISKLVDAFVLLSKKQFSTRVEEDSSHEILVMQKGFNEMADALENRNEQINQEVEKITDDLNTSLQALEIQNIELDIARKEAIESTRMKSRFLANMSHEIRTPMNGVIGFTALLKKSELNEKQVYFVDTIEQSSKKLLQILNDILDYSKLEADKILINHLPFNLKETVSHVINLFTPAAHDKKLQLIAIVYNDVPSEIIGDSLRLAQILSNLLSNAIKFTDSGDVILRVAIDDESSDKIILGFSVTDTGTGISEEDQTKLFKPFAQAETGLNIAESGTGLGLNICESLCQKMGGSLSLESTINLGSTFFVKLPFEINKDKNSSHVFDAISESNFNGLKALIYDNHQLSRASINNQMQNFGFITEETDDIDQFRSIKNNAYFDANIISISPSQLDGIDTFLKPLTDEKSIIFIPSSNNSLINRLSENFHCVVLKSPVSERGLREGLMITLKLDNSEQIQNHSNLASLSSVRELDFSNMNILVVDDNEVNQNLLTSLLEDSNANIISAYDGSEAIEKIHKDEIHLAFMDIHMPVMNGIDATRLIRNSGYQFPVIALTADVGFTDESILIDQGFNGVLIKPVNVDNLKNIISRVYKGETIEIKTERLPVDNKYSDSDSLPIRDKDQALRITDNQISVANKLLFKLVNDLPEMLKELEKHLSEENWKELWQTLHRIHGAASVCAVVALSKTVKDIQLSIEKARYSKLKEEISRLRQEYERLQDFCKKLPKQS